MSAVFAVLVMYDAQGARREVGYHAKVLNQILTFPGNSTPSMTEDGIQPRVSSPNFEEKPSFKSASAKSSSDSSTSCSYSSQTSVVAAMEKDARSLKVNVDDNPLQEKYREYNPLNESVGHTQLQVLFGALLGFIASVVVDAIYS